VRLTATEELVIRRKRRRKNYWRDASDWFWLWRLSEEIIELILALLGFHEDTPSHELEQIAAMYELD